MKMDCTPGIAPRQHAWSRFGGNYFHVARLEGPAGALKPGSVDASAIWSEFTTQAPKHVSTACGKWARARAGIVPFQGVVERLL